MSCVEWWTAFGALATALGAIATTGAVGVALWIGLEPRRILKEQQRLKVQIARKLLEVEIKEAQFAVRHIAFVRQSLSDYGEAGVGELAKLLRSVAGMLQFPLLKECLDASERYSEGVGLAMAETYKNGSALKRTLELLLEGGCTFNELNGILPKIHEVSLSLNTSLAELEELLKG